jgi:RNA polymerase sigma factor (sigma-70 family)
VSIVDPSTLARAGDATTVATMDDGSADDLAAWVERRDETAFRRLVQRHNGVVIAVCRRQLGESDDADEAAQATFIILARRARTVANPAALPSWLHAVALSVCRHARRAAARRARHERSAAMRTSETQHIPDDPAWAELRPRLDDAISALKAGERAVVIGHFLDGLAQAAVAERLGISENAARKRIAAALDKLRSWFARRGISVGSGVLVAGLLSDLKAAEPGMVAMCAKAALAPATAGGATALASSVMGSGISHLAMTGLVVALAVAGSTTAAVRWHARPPAVITAPSALPPPVPAGDTDAAGTILLTYDFEDGLRPSELRDGDLVPGPERAGNRFALAGIRKPHGGGHKNEVVFLDQGMKLFTYRAGTRLSFDCWFTGAPDTLHIWTWDDTQSRNLQVAMPRIPQGRWTRVSVPLATFRRDGDESRGFDPGDRIGNLAISAAAPAASALYIDNLVITRPE